MTNPTTQPTAFGPADIARYWTANGWPSSRQYAAKCIGQGCPAGSLAAALEWRTARTQKRVRSEGGGAQTGSTAKPGLSRIDVSAEILGDSLDAILARARQAEREQYRTYLAAVTLGDTALQSATLRNHKDAQKNLLDVEAMVFEAKKERGEYVSLPEAQKRIDARLGRLRAALPSFPAKLALELFPEAPQRAQARIDKLQAEHFNAPIESAVRPLMENIPAATSPPQAAA